MHSSHPPTRGRSAKVVALSLLMAVATHLLAARLAAGSEADPTVHVELREFASVTGQPTLGDVCRIDEDDPELAKLATRPVLVEGDRIEVADVVRTLRDAGIAEHRIHVRGPVMCAIKRIDVPAVLPESAGEWEELRAVVVSARLRHEESTELASLALSEQLRADLAMRLHLPLEDVRLTLSGDDAMFAAGGGTAIITPLRADDLGRVSWKVRINGVERTVNAIAEATVDQLTLARPVSRGQVIRAGDVEKRRAVITQLSQRGVGQLDVIGQQAARDLVAGSILEADFLAPQLLVKRGQLVTVTFVRGGVEVRTLARSQDDAVYGQTVRATCDSTGEALRVLVTGPQAGTVAR